MNKTEQDAPTVPAVGLPVERPVRRPRVKANVRGAHDFQGRYKQHDLDMMRTDFCSCWYIRVCAPSGMYAYDGYWRDSQGKSMDDAITEACTGAGLL